MGKIESAIARTVASGPQRAPVVNTITKLAAPNGYAVTKAKGPVTIEFAGGSKLSPEERAQSARRLREVTESIFGMPVEMASLGHLVDAPPNSRVEVYPHPVIPLLNLDVYSAGKKKHIDGVMISSGGDAVDIEHFVGFGSPRRSLAPILGSRTPVTEQVADKTLTESWTPIAPDKVYKERLPSGVVFSTTHPEEVNAASALLFRDAQVEGSEPQPLTAEQWAALLGVNGRERVEFTSQPSQLDLTLQRPGVDSDTRTFRKADDGTTVAVHNYLKLGAERGTGKMSEGFVNAATLYNRFGVGRIEAFAAGEGNGSLRQEGSEFVGYYVWPRYGFNGEIPEAVRERMPPELKMAKDLRALFDLPQGPEWWKKHGAGTHVYFDLTPDSENVRAFLRYLEEKKQRTSGAPSQE